jgi:hypothetical protein
MTTMMRAMAGGCTD